MFDLTEEERTTVREWLKTEVFPPILKEQAGTDKEIFQATDEFGITWPYDGAIGGCLTYCFTPTGIGTVIKVRHASGKEIDLTKYDNW